MKKKKKSMVSYPTIIDIPMFKTLEPKSTTKKFSSKNPNISKFKIQGYESGEVSIAKAEKNKKEISEFYKNRFEHGDITAISEIIKINPFFLNENWVKGAVVSSIYNGKIKHIFKRGRRKHDNVIDGMLLVSIVDALETPNRKKENIFHELEDKIGLSYDRIKQLYYETLKNDKRTKALCFVDKVNPKIVNE